jgi:hypothetical protein
MFRKKVPDEALFGATAMVFALCIDTIYRGGTTVVSQRKNQMAALRQALSDMKAQYPGCDTAIGILDQHYPVDPLASSMGLSGSWSSPIQALTLQDVETVDEVGLEAQRAMATGTSGPQMSAVGDRIVLLATTRLSETLLDGRTDHCGLVLGLSLLKVNTDTENVKADERLQRQGYAAALAGHWLVRQLRG